MWKAVIPKLCSFRVKTPFLYHQTFASGTLSEGWQQASGHHLLFGETTTMQNYVMTTKVFRLVFLYSCTLPLTAIPSPCSSAACILIPLHPHTTVGAPRCASDPLHFPSVSAHLLTTDLPSPTTYAMWSPSPGILHGTRVEKSGGALRYLFLFWFFCDKLEPPSPSKCFSFGPYSFQLETDAQIYLVTMVNVNSIQLPTSDTLSIPQPTPGLAHSPEDQAQLAP